MSYNYRSVEIDCNPPYGDWLTFTLGAKDPRSGKNSTVTGIKKSGGAVVVQFADGRDFAPGSYRRLKH